MEVNITDRSYRMHLGGAPAELIKATILVDAETAEEAEHQAKKYGPAELAGVLADAGHDCDGRDIDISDIEEQPSLVWRVPVTAWRTIRTEGNK